MLETEGHNLGPRNAAAQVDHENVVAVGLGVRLSDWGVDLSWCGVEGRYGSKGRACGKVGSDVKL